MGRRLTGLFFGGYMTMKDKKILLRNIADITTTLLLIGAFAIAYYTGFYSKALNTALFAVISSIGVAAMLAVGAFSEFYSRIKRGTVTKSFLYGFISQLLCVILMIILMVLCALSVISIDALFVRILYIIFVLNVTLGYCRSVAYANTIDATIPHTRELEDE